METILLMFSGGIDSTFLLYYYLTETDLPIHVHHISLRYPQLQRWKMEDPAVQKIMEHCLNHYRDFTYSESRFDMSRMNLVGSDQYLQLLVASKVGPNLPGDKVTLALGHCPEDFDSPEDIETARKPGVWSALLKSEKYTKKLNPVLARPILDLNMSKGDVCQKIPVGLLRHCWSCRRPDFVGEIGLPCGECKTCKKIDQIFSKMGRREEFPNLVRLRKPKKTIARRRPYLPRESSTRGTAPPPRSTVNRP